MSTKKVIKKASQTPLQSTTQPQGDSLVNLMATMKSVETKGKEAKKNETSQDDNNNSRYFYNQFESPKKDQEEENNQ